MSAGIAKPSAGSVRLGRQSDMDGLVAIRLAVDENRIDDAARVPVHEYKVFIEHEALFVWEENGELSGFSCGDPTDGTIWALFVRPELSGQGIGSALLDETCRMLRMRGREIATLSTGPDTRAAAFYRKRGWVSLGMTDWQEVQFAKKLDSI